MIVTERYAYLRIVGAFSPETVTQALRSTPTKAWKAGDDFGRGRVRATGMWQLDSRRARTERFEDHVSDLLSQVSDVSDALRDITHSNEGWIHLVSLSTPGQENSSFSKALLSRVTDLGLGMDIEVYTTGNHEVEHAD